MLWMLPPPSCQLHARPLTSEVRLPAQQALAIWRSDFHSMAIRPHPRPEVAWHSLSAGSPMPYTCSQADWRSYENWSG